MNYQKLKQAKLHSFNTAEYKKLELLKDKFLKESTTLTFFEEQTNLQLNKSEAVKMPPLNTLEIYFPKLQVLNLSGNRITQIEQRQLVKSCPNITSLDISYNMIGEMKQIQYLNKLDKLKDLNIQGNPIAIVSKRLCLIECLIMDGYHKKLDEKTVVSYFTANYTHVPRERPLTSKCLTDKKQVFQNCTNPKYQRDILKYVSIEEKTLEGILKMTSITPREGGRFRNLDTLNTHSITVQELSDILYYDKFPRDYTKHEQLYKQQIIRNQDEYQNTALKKGAAVAVRPKSQRPITGRAKSRERLSSQPEPYQDPRPQSMFRFEINGHYQKKEINRKDKLDIVNQKEQPDDEKKRIKLTLSENKRNYNKIQKQITTLKKVNSIATLRYRPRTKESTFIPKVPDMPMVQIKGKNFSKELLEDIKAVKQVEIPMHQSKKKVEKDLRYQLQQKHINSDLLNQSFNSEELGEKVEQEAIKLRDSSSDEEFIQVDDAKREEEEETQNEANDSPFSSQGKRETSVYFSGVRSSNAREFNLQNTQSIILSPNSNGEDFNSCDKFYQDKEKFEEKEKERLCHIARMKQNFHKNVTKAYHLLFRQRNFEAAKKIVREELFKEHTSYEDLKSPELRLEYLRILREKTKLRDELDFYNDQGKFMSENYPSDPRPLQNEMATYQDAIAFYMNCKQNQHSKSDIKKLRQVINKLYPTDPESHYMNKKKFVEERLQKNLGKMDEKEFNKLQNILNIYSKLDSLPPSVKNFDKWLEINQKHQQKWIEKEQAMRRHVDSLPQTKERREKHKREIKEEQRIIISNQNTLKVNNNYFLSPKLYKRAMLDCHYQTDQDKNQKKGEGSTVEQFEFKGFQGDTFTHTRDHDIKQLIKTNNESLPQEKLSQKTKVGFIQKQMSQPQINRKLIMDEWQPLKMKGTILEYLPQYNDFWNKHKKKVFPLEKLEDYIKDPSKYNHTKRVIQNENRKQILRKEHNKLMKQALKSKKANAFSRLPTDSDFQEDKKTIGSKYRIIRANHELMDREPLKKFNQSDSFDLSLYLEDVCEDSQILEKKYQKVQNKEIIIDRKEGMRKNMDTELQVNSIAHGHNMLGKIVNYAYDKHVRSAKRKKMYQK